MNKIWEEKPRVNSESYTMHQDIKTSIIKNASSCFFKKEKEFSQYTFW